jgi:hypothetical protein
MNPSSDFRNSESNYRSANYFPNAIGIRRELHLDRYKESLQTREPGLLVAAGTTQEEPLGLLACLRAGGHSSLFGQNKAGKGAGTQLNNFVSPYPNLTNQNTTELFRELREVRHVTFG